MKKLFLCGFFFISFYYLQAQSLERYVLGSAGKTENTAILSLEWTLGETSIQQGKILTEGFHQPSIAVLPVFPEPLTTTVTGVRVFPNPTNASFRIRAELDPDEQVRIYIFDALGNKLPYANPVFFGTIDEELDLTPYPSGVYRMVLLNRDERLIYSSQIIKY